MSVGAGALPVVTGTALNRCFDVAIGDRVVRFVSRPKQCGNLPNTFRSSLSVNSIILAQRTLFNIAT
ncbi:hypothetical protein BN903_31 [Halorubrum sp. AJ67]|nr:hypothetical protein BN903_31 [Halorubrum sp. AJ67]